MTTTHKTNINDLVPDVVGEILGFLHPHAEENIALKKELKIYGELFKNVKFIFEHEYDKKWTDTEDGSWRWRRKNTKRVVVGDDASKSALHNIEKLLDECLAGRKEYMINKMKIYKRRQEETMLAQARNERCFKRRLEDMKKLANKMEILGIDYSED
jgi:hypothetical protein